MNHFTLSDRKKSRSSEQFLISFCKAKWREKQMDTFDCWSPWDRCAFATTTTKLVYLFLDNGEFQVSYNTVIFRWTFFSRMTAKHLKTSVRLCDAIHTVKIIFHISISCRFCSRQRDGAIACCGDFYSLSVSFGWILFIYFDCMLWHRKTKLSLCLVKWLCSVAIFYSRSQKLCYHFWLVIDINVDDMRSIK